VQLPAFPQICLTCGRVAIRMRRIPDGETGVRSVCTPLNRRLREQHLLQHRRTAYISINTFKAPRRAACSNAADAWARG